MLKINFKGLKDRLDNLYNGYNFKDRLNSDPIMFPHQYKSAGDIEIVGFIASSFAYGRVDMFLPVIAKILSKMGESPYDFVGNFNVAKDGKLFSTIRYRFTDNYDILAFIFILHKILKRHLRLENLFKKNYSNGDQNIKKALAAFVRAFIEQLDLDKAQIQGFSKSSDLKTFFFFFPSPERGSPCKRLNLFLRWMIRDKDIDLGIWKGIPKDKLIIPLDTHIGRISRCLNLTRRKTLDWKTAEEITEALKLFDSKDPLKYDFVLCHYGMSTFCNKFKCEDCSLITDKNRRGR
ncbi:MAG: TIGR02757 family protein [Thermodesulfovibrionales bacterium]|nr:TIGR02757 family protein [Thermodesulfovibrionales bacterium]